MRTWLSPALLAAALLSVWPSAASACVSNPVTTVGKIRAPTARELKRQAAEAQARRIAAARADLRSGRMDAAVGIAEMVVPNVRAVWITTDSCGVSNEYDQAGGYRLEDAKDVFDGTELEGLHPDRFAGFFRSGVVDYRLACNDEFRARLAPLLRRRLPEPELAELYVRLAAARPSSGTRYLRFASSRREPPTIVDEGAPTTVRAVLENSRHPLNEALSVFWASEVPRLADDGAMCPAAHTTFLRARSAWIEEQRTRPYFPRLLANARAGRAARASIPKAAQ